MPRPPQTLQHPPRLQRAPDPYLHPLPPPSPLPTSHPLPPRPLTSAGPTPVRCPPCCPSSRTDHRKRPSGPCQVTCPAAAVVVVPARPHHPSLPGPSACGSEQPYTTYAHERPDGVSRYPQDTSECGVASNDSTHWCHRSTCSPTYLGPWHRRLVSLLLLAFHLLGTLGLHHHIETGTAISFIL